jgi:glyoxylase-like metal-dependent hydrolase (beta-lactamase superfamily II)
VLLYRGEFLFTGDHLSWSRAWGRLTASRDFCWHSWPEQVRSLAKLEPYSFQWVLPGHGQRVQLSTEEMRSHMALLVRGISK